MNTCEMTSKQRNVIEELEWSIHEYALSNGCKGYELEKYSPTGEDFLITVEAENLIENIKDISENFDEEEHIEMWILARRNGVEGVPSTKELIQDASDISEMLKKLATSLSNC